MPIDLGRGNGAAEVAIYHASCTMCRQCLVVCKGQPLYEVDGRICVDQSRIFGCVGCAQCVAVCPTNCIEVRGRDLSPEDFYPLPPREGRATYEQLSSLLVSRRSVRDYHDREVPRDLVQKILDAASTAPMGIPPSEVGVLVRHGHESVREIRDDMLAELKRTRPHYSRPMLWLMRPLLGRDGSRVMKDFIVPAMDFFIESAAKGEDWLAYDPPLALYFYGSEIADAADPIIAATYAMIAAESLGLTSCMLGFPGQILSRSKGLKAKYGLPRKMQPGIMISIGYGKPHFHRAVRRRFARVDG